MAMADGKVHRPPGGDHGRLMVADPGMVRVFVSARQPLRIGADGRFVLAVRADRERRFSKDPLQRVLLVHQQITRTGTDEDLDSGSPPRPLQFAEVVRRGADIEAVVHHAFLCRQRELLLQRGDRDRRGLCVGHLQKRRHAPFGAGEAPGVQVLFMFQPRLAEVHLVVDNARQEMEARRVDHLVGLRAVRRIDAGDLLTFDQDVDKPLAVRQDAGRIFDERAHADSFLRADRIAHGRLTRPRRQEREQHQTTARQNHA
jgi:hypothetical protein